MPPVVTVRAATPADSRDVFDWRNNPLTRAMSHSTDAVAWDGHSKWFAAALGSADRILLICERADPLASFAVVRFDVTGDAARVSINLAPGTRGKGLAKPCLLTAFDHFRRQFPEVSLIEAEIKPENHASRRLFESAGFGLRDAARGVLTFARDCDRP